MAVSDFAAAQATNEAQIPVIDVSGAVNGDDIESVAKAIYAAATDHGFFYISGHGIDQSLLDKAFAISKQFFELPIDKKTTVAVDTNQRGWMGEGMSHLPGAKPTT